MLLILSNGILFDTDALHRPNGKFDFFEPVSYRLSIVIGFPIHRSSRMFVGFQMLRHKISSTGTYIRVLRSLQKTTVSSAEKNFTVNFEKKNIQNIQTRYFFYFLKTTDLNGQNRRDKVRKYFKHFHRLPVCIDR